MGREIKRVPANFNAPLDVTWAGFIMPKRLHSINCGCCDGSGYNEETKEIEDSFYDSNNFGSKWHYNYGFAPDGSPATRHPWQILGTTIRWCNDITQDEVDALVEAGRLYDLTHQWTGGKWVKKENIHITAEQVNQWNQSGMGHDGINRHILIEARAKRLGVYGLCELCKGDGYYYFNNEIKEEAEAWEAEPLPTGTWWQVWQTVSEGAPVTPPFETREELIEYLVQYGDLWDQNRGTGGWTRENAENFVKEDGWKPSFVIADGKLIS